MPSAAEMGIRLLGLTLTGIVQEGDATPSNATKGRSAAQQEELPFAVIEN